MSYLRYICLFAYSGVVSLFFFFLRLLFPMLPAYLDCPFLIAPNVYRTSAGKVSVRQSHVVRSSLAYIYIQSIRLLTFISNCRANLFN